MLKVEKIFITMLPVAFAMLRVHSIWKPQRPAIASKPDKIPAFTYLYLVKTPFTTFFVDQNTSESNYLIYDYVTKTEKEEVII